MKPAIADEICRRLEAGEPIAKICKSDGMPSLSTVRNWTLADPEGFGARYRAAREAGGIKPVGAPFVRGQSGNVSGRPKVPEEVRDLARGYTVEAIEKLAYWMRSDEPKASVAATQALLNRAWGKETQPVEASGGLVVQVVTGVPRTPGE